MFPGRVKAFVKNRGEEAVIILGFLRTLPSLYTSVTLLQGVELDWTWHHLPDVSLSPSLVKCVGFFLAWRLVFLVQKPGKIRGKSVGKS